MLDASGCAAEYGNHTILRNVNLSLSPGDTAAIVGPSGAGKSTLLFLLAGLLAPAVGEVRISGTPVRAGDSRVSLMFQEYGLFPWFTVLENAALGLRIRKRSAEDAVKRAKEELARLGLGGKENRYPHEISGGERQRVALARSLALDPEVLLMDEPFSALDAVTREALQDLLYRELSARPIVTVLVTHSIEEAVYLGNRLFVIRQGSESCLREAVPFSGARDAETRRLPAYFAVCTALRRIMEERG